MSWSLSTTLERKTPPTVIDSAKDVDLLMALDRSNVGNSECLKERDEQINNAINAAYQLFGHPIFANAEEIGVNLSGHANPEHKAKSGWANDTITVQVFVKKYRE